MKFTNDLPKDWEVINLEKMSDEELLKNWVENYEGGKYDSSWRGKGMSRRKNEAELIKRGLKFNK